MYNFYGRPEIKFDIKTIFTEHSHFYSFMSMAKKP